MILNTFAILIAFAAIARLGLGVLVLRLALSPRNFTAAPDSDDRLNLLYLLAIMLAALAIISWPLLYLLLNSYVSQWPGVMCIYGVTRIGTGSRGPAHYLPDLIFALQITRPAVVFAAGAWLVLFRLNRETRTGPLLARLWLAAIPLGVLAAADAAGELAYVVIPKKEEFPTGGCCTVPHADGSRFLPTPLIGEDTRPALTGAYVTLNLTVIIALVVASRRRAGPLALGALLLVGIANAAAGAGFLVDVLAPSLLGLPNHHCAYDLIPDYPVAMAAVGLSCVGLFSLGWACIAGWLGTDVSGDVNALLRLSAFGHAGSLAFVASARALA